MSGNHRALPLLHYHLVTGVGFTGNLSETCLGLLAKCNCRLVSCSQIDRVN